MRVDNYRVLLALLVSACSTQQPLPMRSPMALQTCEYNNKTYIVGQQPDSISIICGFDPRYSALYPRWMPVDYLYPTQLS